jgi:hypothetical protein
VKWLVALVKGIVSALLEWGRGQAERHNTITEVHTPKDVAGKNTEAFKAWKKRKGIK